MRPMHERAYQERGEQYLVIKYPSAEGKSREVEHILHELGDWQRTDPQTGFQLVKIADGTVLSCAEDGQIKRWDWQLHGGEVLVSSQEGEGSTFVLRLPVDLVIRAEEPVEEIDTAVAEVAEVEESRDRE